MDPIDFGNFFGLLFLKNDLKNRLSPYSRGLLEKKEF